MGNLIFRKTAKNANMDIAGSCKITIAEVEEIVPAGSLDPDVIHVPGVLVQRIVKTDVDEKPIERLALHKDGGLQIPGTPEYIRKRVRIAKRAAKEIKTGMFINLGLGMPTLIPNFLPEGVQIVLHGENGVMGVGPYPKEGQQDPDLINASRETITLEPGASTFSSSTSFGIIRGNHLDLTVLGGMQVSSSADLANWLVPGFKVKGMGGAIDLVSSKAKCIVCMDHLAYGNAKILEKCALPLTGKGVVDMLITNYGVFEFRKDTGMTLIEIADDITLDQVKEITPGPFAVDSNLKFMQQ
ncbi:hypothetical protein SteCoe_14417 [Stentor coeruleus]|uniref:Uncharacterized protein n=1 Tax=Stentor coeruleus TaxID=5963 RepID=A0A1R2C618_9CILI|nr:hypothetical protein SteCoe_14417 [Stentor coeruleus]